MVRRSRILGYTRLPSLILRSPGQCSETLTSIQNRSLLFRSVLYDKNLVSQTTKIAIRETMSSVLVDGEPISRCDRPLASYWHPRARIDPRFDLSQEMPGDQLG